MNMVADEPINWTLYDGATCAWPQQPRATKADDIGTGLKWHLVQARGGTERSVMEFLRRYDFESYFPQTRIFKVVPQRMLSKKQRLAGESVRKPKDVPIFPGYLFVRFDMREAPWRGLFEMCGIRGLVCAGDQPTIVHDCFISNLRSLEVDGAVPGATTLSQVFEIGEHVRIAAGPLALFGGVVEELPPKMVQMLRSGRLEDLDESMCATIGVNIFGRITPAKIPLGHLEKV